MKRATLMAFGAIAGLAAIIGVASLSAPPAAKAQPGRDSGRSCFYTNSIDGYSAVDDHTLLVRVGRDIYRAGLMSDCPGLTFRHTLVLKTATGSGSVCGAIDLDIGFTDHGITEKCPVRDLRRLSPGEVAAIPKKFLP
jgi:hypothetical protein